MTFFIKALKALLSTKKKNIILCSLLYLISGAHLRVVLLEMYESAHVSCMYILYYTFYIVTVLKHFIPNLDHNCMAMKVNCVLIFKPYIINGDEVVHYRGY